MNTHARRTNQVAETHARAQCPKGHWTLVPLILDRTLTKQVAKPSVCATCGVTI